MLRCSISSPLIWYMIKYKDHVINSAPGSIPATLSIVRYGGQTYYDYVHSRRSQRCLRLAQLELHTLKLPHNGARFLVSCAKFPTDLASVDCLLYIANIALLIGYSMEDYVSPVFFPYRPASPVRAAARDTKGCMFHLARGRKVVTNLWVENDKR